MVITVLEARVDPDRSSAFLQAYRELASLPDIIHESFLARDGNDDSSWKMITVWASREALEGMRERTRAAGSKPPGVLAFEAAGATPVLTILDVQDHLTH